MIDRVNHARPSRRGTAGLAVDVERHPQAVRARAGDAHVGGRRAHGPTAPLADAGIVPYPGRTMASKRAGKTVKVSVSLHVDDVVVLKRRAREAYGGNLSAAFSEAARWLRQREARRRLVDLLGGPSLTPDVAAALDAEQARRARPAARRARRRTSAA